MNSLKKTLTKIKAQSEIMAIIFIIIFIVIFMMVFLSLRNNNLSQNNYKDLEIIASNYYSVIFNQNPGIDTNCSETIRFQDLLKKHFDSNGNYSNIQNQCENGMNYKEYITDFLNQTLIFFFADSKIGYELNISNGNPEKEIYIENNDFCNSNLKFAMPTQTIISTYNNIKINLKVCN